MNNNNPTWKQIDQQLLKAILNAPDATTRLILLKIRIAFLKRELALTKV